MLVMDRLSIRHPHRDALPGIGLCIGLQLSAFIFLQIIVIQIMGCQEGSRDFLVPTARLGNEAVTLRPSRLLFWLRSDTPKQVR